jgi:GR25 family glycosyltransferase involved in LPS biosynthesis
VERRQYMEKQLHYYGFTSVQRIRAVTIKDVVIPQEISRQQDCEIASNLTKSFVTSAKMFNNASAANPYKIMVQALCGRPKNSRRELIVTISHLQALRAAVNSKSSSPYALILEDDMRLGFDIDFHALAAAAPQNFGILQLVTSNDYDVKFLYERYVKKTGPLWWRREDRHDYWCAGAYLVNKTMLRPILQTIISDLQNGWQGVSIVAGFGGMTPRGAKETCVPASCCPPHAAEYPPPCVKAPRGFQSDHYLFSLTLGKTHMISLPLITTASSGNSSTLHQDHVAMHVGAFHRINKCLDDIAKGTVPVPSYVNTQCSFALT